MVMYLTAPKQISLSPHPSVVDLVGPLPVSPLNLNEDGDLSSRSIIGTSPSLPPETIGLTDSDTVVGRRWTAFQRLCELSFHIHCQRNDWSSDHMLDWPLLTPLTLGLLRKVTRILPASCNCQTLHPPSIVEDVWQMPLSKETSCSEIFLWMERR